MRLAVLGSTRGTALPALCSALHADTSARLVFVLSNKPDALILQKAKALDVPAACLNPAGLTREAYDALVVERLKAEGVEGVVLLGYMRLVSAGFLRAFPHRVMNVHPSLLPAHAGLMDLAVHQAVLDAGDAVTGCTVHEVIEAVDAGPILVQKRCVVMPNDTPDTLKARVQALEVPALVEAIRGWVT